MTLREWLNNLWQLLLVPTVRRITDRRRRGFSVLLCLVLFVCAAELAMFCFTFGAALARADGMSEELTAFFSSADGTRTRDAAFMTLLGQIRVGRFRAVSVMAVCAVLWLLSAAAALTRLFRASVDSETYVFGLRILFGADRRQLARSVRCEFLLLGGCAALPAIPAAYAAVALLAGEFVPLWPLWIILPALILLCSLSARVTVRRLYRLPCVSLVNSGQTPGSLSSPRTSTLPGGSSGTGSLHYARLSIRRRAKYAVSFVLSACLAADGCLCLWMMSVADPGSAGQADGTGVQEYAVTFPYGSDSDTLLSGFTLPLSGLPGVTRVDASAIRTAAQYGTFLLLDSACVRDTSAALPVGDLWLLDDVTIICGDGNNHAELGGQVPYAVAAACGAQWGTYSFGPVAEGNALYVHSEHTEPRMDPSGYVRIPLPGSDTDYLTVHVTAGLTVPCMSSKGDVCPRITEDVLILSPADYALVTGDTSVVSIHADECLPEELSLGADECILILPDSAAAQAMRCDTVTALTPEVPITDPFRSVTHREGMKQTLDDPDFCINRTGAYTMLYMGSSAEFRMDPQAQACLDAFRTAYAHREPYHTVSYRVKDVIVSSGVTEPRVLLPVDERMTWSIHWADMTAFTLVSTDTENGSRLYRIGREDNVLLCEDARLNVPADAQLILPSLADGEFISRMESAHVSLSAEDTSLTVYELHGVWHRRDMTLLFAVPTREGGDGWYLYPDKYNEFTPSQDYPAYYPVHPTGADGMLMTRGSGAYSAVSLSDCGSGLLLFTEQIGSRRADARPLGTCSALDAFTICPAPESGYLTEDGRPTFPEPGHAILAGRLDELADLHVGDVLSLALAEAADGDPAAAYESRLVREALPGRFAVMSVVIDEMLPGDGEPTLILPESDLCRVTGTNALYTGVRVWVEPGLSVLRLLTIRDVMMTGAARTGGTFTEEGRVIAAAASRQDVTVGVLRLTLPLAALLLPVLLLAQHAAFCAGRRDELETFRVIGLTSGFIRGLLQWEVVILSALAGLGTLLGGGVCVILSAGLMSALGIPPSLGAGTGIALRLCAGWSLLSSLTAGLICAASAGRASGRSGARRALHPPKQCAEKEGSDHESDGM